MSNKEGDVPNSGGSAPSSPSNDLDPTRQSTATLAVDPSTLESFDFDRLETIPQVPDDLLGSPRNGLFEQAEQLPKEGWLKKKGTGGLKTWSSRYFSLREGVLEWFKSEKKLTAESRGIVELKGTRCVFVNPEDNKFVMILSLQDGDRKEPIILEAASQQDRLEWGQSFMNHGATVQQPLKQGVMYKTGSTNKTWRKRWFLLYDDGISYYKDRKDEDVAGVIPLPGGTVVRLEVSQGELGHGEIPFTFSITADVEDKKTRTYFINATSAAMRDDWVQVIQDVVANKTARKCSDSILEGYLMLGGSGLDRWEKRYVVVGGPTGDILTMFPRKADEKSVFECPIIGDSLVSVEFLAQGKAMFSLVPNADESPKKLFLLAKTIDEQKKWVELISSIIKKKIRPKIIGSLREGYIYRPDGPMGRWTRYYVSLLPELMVFFKKKHEPNRISEVPVPAGMELELVEQDLQFTLLDSGDEGAKRNVFRCLDKKSQDEWIQTITALLNSKNVKVFDNSIIEGHMFKCNKDMKNWTKRWFVMLPDKIMYFRKRLDKQEAGEILLPGGAFVQPEPETKDKRFLFSVRPSGDEGTRTFLISALGEEQRSQWISALKKLLATKVSTVNSFSMKEGYLDKCNARGQHWHPRYFILWQDSLLYYKTKPVKNDEKEAGTVPLDADSTIEEDSLPDSDKKFLLSIRGGDEDARKYYMNARDMEERTEWITVLRDLVSRKTPTKVDPESVKEGYLSKTGSTFKDWHKRYFILKDNALKYYRAKGEKKEAGVVSLTPYTTVQREPDSEQPFVFSLTTTARGRVYRSQAPSLEEMESWMQAIRALVSAFGQGKLFGGSLLDGVCRSSRLIPDVCYECVTYLKQYMKTSGLFRAPPPNPELLNIIKDGFEKGDVDVKLSEPLAAAALLKLYFKEMVDPLIPSKFYHEFVDALDDVKNASAEEKWAELKPLVFLLPEDNKRLFVFMIQFLHELSRSGDSNGMTAKFCGTIFAPIFLRKPDPRNTGKKNSLSMMGENIISPMGGEAGGGGGGGGNGVKRGGGSISWSLTGGGGGGGPMPPLSKESGGSGSGSGRDIKEKDKLTDKGGGGGGGAGGDKEKDGKGGGGGGAGGAGDKEKDKEKDPYASVSASVAAMMMMSNNPANSPAQGSPSLHSKKGPSSMLDLEKAQTVIETFVDGSPFIFPTTVKTYKPKPGEEEALEHFWEEKTEADGTVFYLNGETNKKTTEKPGPLKKDPTEWTLANILEYEPAYSLLRENARETHTGENMEFHDAIEAYQKLGEIKHKSRLDPATVMEQAYHIYNQYLKTDAVSEVNISDSMRKQLSELFEKPDELSKLELHALFGVFKEAHEEVLLLVKNNQLWAFTHSERFAKLVAKIISG